MAAIAEVVAASGQGVDTRILQAAMAVAAEVGIDGRAAEAGMRPEIDPYLVGDILFGALLARLFSTGRAPGKATTDQLVDMLLNGVRRR